MNVNHLKCNAALVIKVHNTEVVNSCRRCVTETNLNGSVEVTEIVCSADSADGSRVRRRRCLEVSVLPRRQSDGQRGAETHGHSHRRQGVLVHHLPIQGQHPSGHANPHPYAF